MAIRLMRFPWNPSGIRWYRLPRGHRLGIRPIAGGLVVQWLHWSLYLVWRN